MEMTLVHDQVSATRAATHAVARQAGKTAHQAVGAAHEIDLKEPARAAKALTKRAAKQAAKQAAKTTGRAAARKSKRGAGRGLRVILIALVAGGLLALAVAAFRRMRATSSRTPTNASFDRFEAGASSETQADAPGPEAAEAHEVQR